MIEITMKFKKGKIRVSAEDYALITKARSIAEKKITLSTGKIINPTQIKSVKSL